MSHDQQHEGIVKQEMLILPDWPAPANVRAMQTTRHGGKSQAPYASFNLGMHVGDVAMDVAANRQKLNRWVPTEPVWLNQVHGIAVVDAAQASCVPDADAAFARHQHTVCTVMTADCLPVLLCDEAGTVVAAVHAGWRSLLDGVIEATVQAMAAQGNLLAWLGPAIGPEAFEVGAEVRAAFIAKDARAEQAFKPGKAEGKCLGDIYAIARQRLDSVGVSQVYGGGFCTYSDSERFFSFRRDQVTGRMASLIWLE